MGRKKDAGTSLINGGVYAYYNSYLNAIELSAVKARIITVGVVGHYINNFHENETTIYYYGRFSNIGQRVDVCAPGVNILSAVLENGYAFMNGTSMAAPYIAGLAGLLYQANPELKAVQVKQIICNHIATTVKDAHGNTYGMPDAVQCMEKAKSIDTSSTGGMLPKGILMGKIVDGFHAPLKDVKVTAYRTSIGESNLENYYQFGYTDEFGNYEMFLTEGTYNLNVYTEGYLPCVIENISIHPNETTYMENLFAIAWTPNYAMASMKGKVIHALNGNAVEGAEIRLRKGWNNRTGDYVADMFGQVRKTVTASLLEAEGGVFKYSVHNYTDYYKSDSKTLSLSGAMVRLYSGMI